MTCTSAASFVMTDTDFMSRTLAGRQQSRPRPRGASARLRFNGFGRRSPGSRLLPMTAYHRRTRPNVRLSFHSHTFDHQNLDAATYDFPSRSSTEQRVRPEPWIRNFTHGEFREPRRVRPQQSGCASGRLRHRRPLHVTDNRQPGWSTLRRTSESTARFQPASCLIPRRPTILLQTSRLQTSGWRSTTHLLLVLGPALSYRRSSKGEPEPPHLHAAGRNRSAHVPSANTRAYDGVTTLLGDLLDVAFPEVAGFGRSRWSARTCK